MTEGDSFQFGLGLNLQELSGKDRKTTGRCRTTGTESEIRARQKVTLITGGYFRRTAPLIACEPKWPLAGFPNTSVMFENSA
jgi:hypothetical protein